MFGLIECIYVMFENKTIIFEFSLFKTLFFDERLYCYDVELTDNILFCNYDTIYSYIPNTKSVTSNNRTKIVLRSPV